MPSSLQTITLHLHQRHVKTPKYQRSQPCWCNRRSVPPRMRTSTSSARDAMPIKGCFQNPMREKQQRVCSLLKSVNSSQLSRSSPQAARPNVSGWERCRHRRLCWFEHCCFSRFSNAFINRRAIYTLQHSFCSTKMFCLLYVAFTSSPRRFIHPQSPK